MSLEADLGLTYKQVHHRLSSGYGRAVVDHPIDLRSKTKPEPSLIMVRQISDLTRRVMALESLLGRVAALENTVCPPPIPISPSERILRLVAKHEGIPKLGLISGRRNAALVRIRHLGIYLCVLCTKQSMTQIALAWGMDHTSVMHARDRIEAMLAAGDEDMKNKVEWYRDYVVNSGDRRE